MDKKNVSIFIDTSIKGPMKKKGSYMYLLDARKKSGETVTRNQWMALDETTENQASVFALAAALARLNCPCVIELWIDCTYLASALENRWFDQWKKNEWKNRKGQPVADAEKWQQIECLLSKHEIHLHLGEHHEYSEWMRREIKSKEEKHYV